MAHQHIKITENCHHNTQYTVSCMVYLAHPHCNWTDTEQSELLGCWPTILLSLNFIISNFVSYFYYMTEM